MLATRVRPPQVEHRERHPHDRRRDHMRGATPPVHQSKRQRRHQHRLPPPHVLAQASDGIATPDDLFDRRECGDQSDGIHPSGPRWSSLSRERRWQDRLQQDHQDAGEDEQRNASGYPHQHLPHPPLSPESKVGEPDAPLAEEEKHDGENDVLRRGAPDEGKATEGSGRDPARNIEKRLERGRAEEYRDDLPEGCPVRGASHCFTARSRSRLMPER